MDALNDIVLQIYRAAREQPVDEFQDFVLGVVRSLIPFDSCRWATAEMDGTETVTRFIHLQNEPEDIVHDWETISAQDRFKDMMIAHPGRAIAICTQAFFASRESAEIRDYTKRYRHANSLGVLVPAPLPRHWDSLSLWRARDEKSYSDAERRLLEQLMPHMIEALEHSRMHGLDRAGVDPLRAANAIVGRDGALSYASGAFIRLLQDEWPDWQGCKLPSALLTPLVRKNGARYVGAAIDVTAKRLGEALFLRAGRSDPLARLSPREARVARLYGEGHAYKAIAKQLDLSPATVRVFLQRIYGKLGINDKARLAALLAHRESAPGAFLPSPRSARA